MCHQPRSLALTSPHGYLYLRPLKLDISDTEHIIFFISHLLCLPSTPALDSLTYYSRRHHIHLV